MVYRLAVSLILVILLCSLFWFLQIFPQCGSLCSALCPCIESLLAVVAIMLLYNTSSGCICTSQSCLVLGAHGNAERTPLPSSSSSTSNPYFPQRALLYFKTVPQKYQRWASRYCGEQYLSAACALALYILLSLSKDQILLLSVMVYSLKTTSTQY